MSFKSAIMKIESCLSDELKAELESKGWLTLLAEGATLCGLCVVSYIAVALTYIIMI